MTKKKIAATAIATVILACLGLKYWLFWVEDALYYTKSTPRSPRPSRGASDDRRPLPPEVLATALQDRVHKETGMGRPAKSVKVPLRRSSTERSG
jgi:hypothetical protein